MSVGVHRNGAFAESLSLPADNVWRCSPKVPRELYAIFDPLGNAVHTALSFDVLGEDVLITGAGPIGIMAVTIVRQAGARHVVITDINDYRLKLAKKMGASLAVNVEKQRVDTIQKKLGMHEGFDVGLEMSGNAGALRDMIANMVHGGKIAMLGIQESNTGIDWNRVVFGGITIKGIYGREMYESWYKATMLIESGMDISAVITHRYAFSDFEKGFAAIKQGRAAKVVLSWA
jgi:threonine 3-dehydrogenase